MIVTLDLASTDPAPVLLAAMALHVIAAACLFGGHSAMWTGGCWVDGHVQLEAPAAIRTPASVPDFAALEAHILAAFALSLVRAAAKAWLYDGLATVRARAPFQSLVRANLHIVADCPQHRCYF